MTKEIKLTHEEANAFQLMPPCMYCEHLSVIGTQEDYEDYTLGFKGWACKAFPEEIPSDILRREVSHMEPDWGQAIGNTHVYSPKVTQKTNGKAVMTWDGDWVEIE